MLEGGGREVGILGLFDLLHLLDLSDLAGRAGRCDRSDRSNRSSRCNGSGRVGQMGDAGSSPRVGMLPSPKGWLLRDLLRSRRLCTFAPANRQRGLCRSLHNGPIAQLV